MIEMLVGLEVTDDKNYAQYREAMSPILTGIGGGFGYDLKISEVLKSESENKINRVFTIFFPSEEVMNAFFTDSHYLEIKKKFFEGAVSSTTIMASYKKS